MNTTHFSTQPGTSTTSRMSSADNHSVGLSSRTQIPALQPTPTQQLTRRIGQSVKYSPWNRRVADHVWRDVGHSSTFASRGAGPRWISQNISIKGAQPCLRDSGRDPPGGSVPRIRGSHRLGPLAGDLSSCRWHNVPVCDRPAESDFRSVTQDGLPLIGAVPGAPGAFVATGHSVSGILNVPAMRSAVAELILARDDTVGCTH